LNIFYRSL